MSSTPVFLADDLADPLPELGSVVALSGPDLHHVAVRRIRTGETLTLADGRGRGVRGPAVEVGKARLSIEVAEQLRTPQRPLRFVAVQALAKGGRDELAIEMMTELGVDEVVGWQASRCVVRWSADRAVKGVARWRACVREAAKQSRRLWVPEVAEPVSTGDLAALVGDAEVALVLHESASLPLRAVSLPASGTVLVVVGPEGGIDDAELATLRAAGAREVSLGDAVLRTSTAGVVALAGLMLR